MATANEDLNRRIAEGEKVAIDGANDEENDGPMIKLDMGIVLQEQVGCPDFKATFDFFFPPLIFFS